MTMHDLSFDALDAATREALLLRIECDRSTADPESAILDRLDAERFCNRTLLTLPARVERIIRLRYGLAGVSPLRQSEIAAQFGLRASARIQQLEQRGMARLRQHAERTFPPGTCKDPPRNAATAPPARTLDPAPTIHAASPLARAVITAAQASQRTTATQLNLDLFVPKCPSPGTASHIMPDPAFQRSGDHNSKLPLSRIALFVTSAVVVAANLAQATLPAFLYLLPAPLAIIVCLATVASAPLVLVESSHKLWNYFAARPRANTSIS